MIRLDDKRCIIGFDDGYQLGKTANFMFDNGVHMLGSIEPTLKENSLFYDGDFFKVGEGRAAITDDKIVFCQALFPEKSVKIPFFRTGNSPAFGETFFSSILTH